MSKPDIPGTPYVTATPTRAVFAEPYITPALPHVPQAHVVAPPPRAHAAVRPAFHTDAPVKTELAADKTDLARVARALLHDVEAQAARRPYAAIGVGAALTLGVGMLFRSKGVRRGAIIGAGVGIGCAAIGLALHEDGKQLGKLVSGNARKLARRAKSE